MSTDIGLDAIIKHEMSDIISAYSIKLISVNANEVLLKSLTYTIDIVTDRDGVSIIYFDTDQKPVKGYNLFLFLANKRREKLTFSKSKPTTNSYIELIASETHALSTHLRNAAQDILGGSKDWIKEYSWPTIQLPPELAGMI